MADYKHILLALDFSPTSEELGRKAVALAATHLAKVSLIHVVDYVPLDAANEWMVPPQVEVQHALIDNARRQLAALARTLGVADAPQWVELGSPKGEIARVAEAQGVDLIVIGSHGRHGIARVLGSTANAVLHTAPCDVLAVRLSS